MAKTMNSDNKYTCIFIQGEIMWVIMYDRKILLKISLYEVNPVGTWFIWKTTSDRNCILSAVSVCERINLLTHRKGENIYKLYPSVLSFAMTFYCSLYSNYIDAPLTVSDPFIYFCVSSCLFRIENSFY